MFDSSENLGNSEKHEAGELKEIALDILGQIPEASILTAKKKEALATDAVIFLNTQHDDISNVATTEKIIRARIAKTLQPYLYNPENPENDALRKGPSNKEQLKRHEMLAEALMKIKNDPALQKKIIEETIKTLKGEAAKNTDTDHGLTKIQLQDVIVNFLHHAFNNKILFTNKHALAVLKKLYLNDESDQAEYDKAKEIFLNHIQYLLSLFLSLPNIKEKYNTTKDAEKFVPKTEQQKELIKWDYLLLQHGNLNSRNKVILSLRHLIKKCVNGIFRKNGLLPRYLYEDVCQTVEEKLTEKLCMYDVKQSSPPSFFQIAIRRLAYRELNSMELVRQPYNVHYQRYVSQRYPEHQQEYIKPVHLVYADQPLDEDREHPLSLAEMLPQMQITETPEDIALRNDLHNEFINLIESLSPREKEIITDRTHGVTLETAGKKHGLSKQRINQIMFEILNKKKFQRFYKEIKEAV